MLSITYSIAIAPCGPPKPRNAVFDWVLVFRQAPGCRRRRGSTHCRSGRRRGCTTGPDRSAENPARNAISIFAAQDAAVVVEPDVVLVVAAMPLAGDHEVVVAVQADLDRAPAAVRGHRRDAGEDRRLRFLAAEAAAHPPHLAAHLVRHQVQARRDDVLHFGRDAASSTRGGGSRLPSAPRRRSGLRGRTAPGRRRRIRPAIRRGARASAAAGSPRVRCIGGST